jgi:TolA-binding protein
VVAREYGALIDHFFTTGKPDTAMRLIEETHLVEITPTMTVSSLYEYANFLVKNGRFDAAIQVLHRVAAEYPQSSEGKLAYFDIASIHLTRLARPAEAVAVLQEHYSGESRLRI